MDKLFMKICEGEEAEAEDYKKLNPLTLAYIGDSVYELFVRTSVLKKGGKVDRLHKTSIQYVKAKAQASALRTIMDLLTEEEKIIIRRARNNKGISVPKNSSHMDYRNATGFEALIGYLYLSHQDNRLMEIIDKSLKEIEQVIEKP